MNAHMQIIDLLSLDIQLSIKVTSETDGSIK